MNQIVLGLQVQAWLVITLIVVLALAVYRRWAVSADGGRQRQLRLADQRRQQEHVARMNRALRHPDPVEPAPLDHVREGRGVPRPRSSATLAEQVDDLRAQVQGGTGAGPLPPTSSAPSTTPASSTGGTGGSSASGPSGGPSGAGASTDPLTTVKQALEGLRPQK